MSVGVISFQNRQEDTKLSDLAMANIEALAAGEIPVRCGPNEIAGYFMSYYTESRVTFGGKPCDSPSYSCNCGCRVYFSVEECSCESANSVVIRVYECKPTNNKRSCCDKSEERTDNTYL